MGADVVGKSVAPMTLQKLWRSTWPLRTVGLIKPAFLRGLNGVELLLSIEKLPDIRHIMSFSDRNEYNVIRYLVVCCFQTFNLAHLAFLLKSVCNVFQE